MEFKRIVSQPEEDINLAQAALLIAADEYPDLNADAYLRRLDDWGQEARTRTELGRTPREKLELLSQFLFEDLKFRGNQENYYDPHNSYLNDVIEHRVGLPITLSIVYIEVGRRADLPLYGVGLPGHFIVKWYAPGEEIFVDPFHGGAILDEYDLLRLIQETYHARVHLHREWVEAIGPRLVLARMLNNLRGIFLKEQKHARALQVIEKLLVLEPHSEENLRDAGLLAYRLGQYRQAAEYLEEYLLRHPEGSQATHMRAYLRSVWVQITRLN